MLKYMDLPGALFSSSSEVVLLSSPSGLDSGSPGSFPLPRVDAEADERCEARLLVNLAMIDWRFESPFFPGARWVAHRIRFTGFEVSVRCSSDMVAVAVRRDASWTVKAAVDR